MIHLTETRAAPSSKRYLGGCLCGGIQYEVELEASAHAGRGQNSVWERSVPASGFRLLADDSLSGHQFSAHGGHHFFCERCGVRPFSRHNPESPGRDYYVVDLKWLA